MKAEPFFVAFVLIGVALTGFGTFFFVDSGSCSTYYLSVDSNDGEYTDAPTKRFDDLSREQRVAFRKALDADGQVAVSELHFDRPTRVEYRGRSYVVLSMVSDGCKPLLHNVVRSAPLAVGLLLLAITGIWKYWERN